MGNGVVKSHFVMEMSVYKYVMIAVSVIIFMDESSKGNLIKISPKK